MTSLHPFAQFVASARGWSLFLSTVGIVALLSLGVLNDPARSLESFLQGALQNSLKGSCNVSIGVPGGMDIGFGAWGFGTCSIWLGR